MCSEIASAYSTMTVFSLWHHYAPSPLHHVWMWKLDHKEGWVLKNWCFWTVVLKKTLESPLDSKEIKLVNTKGNQSWIFIGGTDAEAETPILWPLDAKNWLIGKSPDAGKDWRQEKRLTENEMIGWHHPTLWTWVWVSPRRWWRTGKPAWCSPWGHKVSDITEWLNWTNAPSRALQVGLVLNISHSVISNSLQPYGL